MEVLRSFSHDNKVTNNSSVDYIKCIELHKSKTNNFKTEDHLIHLQNC